MNEADYWRLAHNALQARYDDLLQRVASGQMLVSAPQITADVMSLSDDLKRQTLIALGWTPPGARTPLTEAQIHDLKAQAMNNVPMARQRYIEFARLIERAHDIKEKP